MTVPQPVPLLGAAPVRLPPRVGVQASVEGRPFPVTDLLAAGSQAFRLQLKILLQLSLVLPVHHLTAPEAVSSPADRQILELCFLGRWTHLDFLFEVAQLWFHQRRHLVFR